ncbi:hypothetical protein TKK_0009542 [Trichogramma kaykai]
MNTIPESTLKRMLDSMKNLIDETVKSILDKKSDNVPKRETPSENVILAPTNNMTPVLSSISKEILQKEAKLELLQILIISFTLVN